MVARAIGHKPTVHLVSSESNKTIGRIELQFSPINIGMEPIQWNGSRGPDFLFNCGWLWDMVGCGTCRQCKVPRRQIFHRPTGAKCIAWLLSRHSSGRLR